MCKNNKNGFTLVELLAVIVILAIILVIAVPKVMDVINDSKKATLESTVKMIASAAEKAKVQNTVLGKDKEINCEDIVKLNDIDYDKCIIEFNEDNNALVTIKGKGKFSNLNVCAGDKTSATANDRVCTVEYTKASTYIEKLEAFTTNNGIIIDDTEDKNVRYVGSNPNNKVYFNCKDTDTNNINYGEENYDYASSCEVWRIIGVFEVDNGSGKLEKRVKLVRDNVLIYASWDSSDATVNAGAGINQWGESTYEDETFYEGADLMRMLNRYYIGKEDTCLWCTEREQKECPASIHCSSTVTQLSSSAKSMIDYALWDIGRISYMETMPLSKMYIDERTLQIDTTCSGTCNDKVNRKNKWLGIIGLIYASDYGYASAQDSCKNDIIGQDSTCNILNWLYIENDNYWIFPLILNSKTTIFRVLNDNYNITSAAAYGSHGIRPSLYLSSSIKIIGGDGGEAPFKLAM